MKNKTTISMKELIDILDTKEEENKVFDPSWYKEILYQIK